MRSRHEYDPADFIVPPEKKGGHAHKISGNIQSGHHRAIVQVLRSGVFPFGTEQDFLRWAIREALLRVEELEPELIGSTMKIANAMLYDLQIDAEQAKFEEFLTALSGRVRELVGRGSSDMAQSLVRRIWAQILSMPDAPERELQWKCKYVDVMRGQFAEFLPPEHDEEAGS